MRKYKLANGIEIKDLKNQGYKYIQTIWKTLVYAKNDSYIYINLIDDVVNLKCFGGKDHNKVLLEREWVVWK